MLRKAKFWILPVGVNRIRFLPNENSSEFYQEFRAHYIPDALKIVKFCTERYDCPYCQQGHKTVERVLFNIYDMNQSKLPNKRREVLIWHTSGYMLKKILDIYSEHGDITHHSKGRNIAVILEEVDPYARLQVSAEIKPSRVQIFRGDLYDLREVLKNFQTKPIPHRPYLRMIRLE